MIAAAKKQTYLKRLNANLIFKYPSHQKRTTIELNFMLYIPTFIFREHYLLYFISSSRLKKKKLSRLATLLSWLQTTSHYILWSNVPIVRVIEFDYEKENFDSLLKA